MASTSQLKPLATKTLLVQVPTLVGENSHSCQVASTINVIRRTEHGHHVGDGLLIGPSEKLMDSRP